MITQAQVKTFMSIKDSSKDALINLLIPMVEKYVERYTQRVFTSTVYTEELYDGTSSYDLVLKNYPVITFTKLEVNNSVDNSDNWEEIDSSDYWVDETIGLIHKTSTFILGKQRYRATYTAGYASIPDDIQYALLVLISSAISKSGAEGIKSETLGDHSITFESVIQTNEVVKNILNNYRKIPLC